MLATTMQQCYHSANMLPMLTLLPYHIPHSILTPPLPSHLNNLCKIDFSKAKRLPMLADTVQHCYHSANVLLMLTVLPTTYPIQLSPLHSLHNLTTLAKLTFQKQRVCQCWQPLCNSATTLPMFPMLTLLLTTYPIQFSPLPSNHTSTNFAKLTFSGNYFHQV